MVYGEYYVLQVLDGLLGCSTGLRKTSPSPGDRGTTQPPPSCNTAQAAHPLLEQNCILFKTRRKGNSVWGQD